MYITIKILFLGAVLLICFGLHTDSRAGQQVQQVQYYISPTYPKPCFISAYIPNKASQSPKFAYNPAGRLPDGSEPSTPNEYWSGKVPAAGGTIAPSAIVPWTHDKYEFMTDGNWRVRAKVNPFSTVTESNYGNNTYTYNFPIPN